MEWLRKTVATGQRAPFPSPTPLPGDNSVEAYFNLLLAHYDLHQSQGHRSCAREMLELAQTLVQSDPELHYRWLRKWVRWLESVGRREEGLELLQQHLRKLRGKLNNPNRNADVRMELGILLDRAKKKHEALRYFRDAAQRYRKLNSTYNYVAALFNSASVAHDIGQFSEALRWCRKALQEGVSGYRDLFCHVSLQMANSLESSGQQPEAINHFRQAEENYGMQGNRRQQADILHRLGWLAGLSKQWSDSAHFLRRALELKQEHDYAVGLARYHHARGEAYRSANLPKRAVSYYRSALNLALASNQDAVSASCRLRLYEMCAKPGQALSQFVRFGKAADAESIVKQGRAGLYLDHGHDGFSSDVFRETGDPPKPRLERRVVSKLVQDLEKVTRASKAIPPDSLRKQKTALLQWLERQNP